MKNILAINHIPVCDDVQLIMLDKDGTLIDAHHYWLKMINERAKKIIKNIFLSHSDPIYLLSEIESAMGVDHVQRRLKADGPVGVKPRPFIVSVVTETINKYSPTRKDVVEIEAIFKEVDEESSRDMLPFLKLLPGVLEFLITCKNRAIKVMVVTTDITPRAERAMSALNLSKYIDGIIGGDLVAKTKPFPELAYRAIEQANCSSNKSVVIGDHPVDIEMGRSAGVICNIGVLTGLSSEEAFRGQQCHIIKNFSDLYLE